jgi:hypothetical protein
MKTSKIVSICTLFVFCACAQNPTVSVVRSVEFNTGIIDFSGAGIYNNNEGKEIIYFTDRNTQLFTKTFDLHGNKIDSIPLVAANVFCNAFRSHIGRVHIFAKDSILVCSSYYSHLSLINSAGKILKTAWIDDYLPDSLKEVNEYHMLLPNTSTNLDKLFFVPRAHDRLTLERGYKMFTYDYYYDYYKTQYSTPAVLEAVNVFDEKPALRFFAKNYYKKKSPEPYIIESSSAKFLNGKVYVVSADTPDIVEFSGNDFEQEKHIAITSKYGKFIEKYMIKDVFGNFQTTQKGYKQYENERALSGAIINIFYNQNTKKYYILSSHQLKNEEEYKKYGYSYHPFSVFVSNGNFEHFTEYAFEANTYNYQNAVMTSEGLMIQRKDTNININNYGTQTFDLLGFN